jgi:hypothetical protein
MQAWLLALVAYLTLSGALTICIARALALVEEAATSLPRVA